MRSMFTIFSNGSIIPPGFKFTELHTLTLAARFYVLLIEYIGFEPCVWSNTRHIVYSETKVDEPEHKKYKSRDGSVKKVSNH